MLVEIAYLVVLVVGVGLGVILARTFAKSSGSAPTVKLVRTARTVEGREETRLFVNDAAILTATNDGVRLAEYADEVEQLEALAARLAASMGVTVEFARVAARTPGADNAIPMRKLPAEQLASSDPAEDFDTRRARLDDQQASKG